MPRFPPLALSLVRALERLPTTFHLFCAEIELRLAPTDALPRDQRAARGRCLDALCAYRRAGAFPRNAHELTRAAPCFIDADGRRCAVASLLDVTGRPELALGVARTSNTARVREMDRAPLAAWAGEMGLTIDELARVQPTYGPSADELARFNGVLAAMITLAAIGAVSLLANLGRLARAGRTHVWNTRAVFLALAGLLVLGFEIYPDRVVGGMCNLRYSLGNAQMCTLCVAVAGMFAVSRWWRHDLPEGESWRGFGAGTVFARVLATALLLLAAAKSYEVAYDLADRAAPESVAVAGHAQPHPLRGQPRHALTLGGRERRFPGLRAVAFSRDDARLAVWDSRGPCVIDAATGSTLWRGTFKQMVSPHWKPEYIAETYRACLVFLPDGKLAGAVRGDKQIQVWDPVRGPAPIRFVSVGEVDCLTLSGDGGTLVVTRTGERVTLELLDAANLELAGLVPLPVSGHCAIDVSPDRRQVLCGTPEQHLGGGHVQSFVHLLDVATGSSVKRFQTYDEIRSVAFLSGGRFEAAGEAPEIFEFDGEREVGRRPTRPGERVRARHLVGPGASKLLVIQDGHESSLKLEDRKTGAEVSLGDGWLWCVSPSGRRVAVGSQYTGLAVRDAETGRPLWSPEGHAGAVARLAFSPAQDVLASYGADRTVCRWSTATGSLLSQSKAAQLWGNSRGLAIGADGAITVTGEAAVHVVQARDGWQAPEALPAPDGRPSLAASADRRVTVSGSDRGDLVVFRGTDAVLRLTRGERHSHIQPQLSPDGRYVAAWTPQSQLEVLDVTRGVTVGSVPAYESGHLELESPGPLLRSYTLTPAYVSIWLDVRHLSEAQRPSRNGQPGVDATLFMAQHPHAGVQACALRFDRRVVAAADGLTVKLLDVARKGQEIARLPTDDHPASAVALSPDGRKLAVGLEDGSLRVFEVPLDIDATRR